MAASVPEQGPHHPLKACVLMLRFLAFIILTFSAFASFAWNATGHRVIGEIAYAHLTPKAKDRVNQLVEYLSDAYPYSSTFQTANAWADYLKEDDVEVFNAWHFYNLPYDDASKTPPPPNLLWALNQSIMILKSDKSNQFEKAFFLRFLLHFEGDAHQPLHCIDRNDRGGNLFLIQNNNYSNLHAYWDSGLGLFDEKCGLSPSKSRRVACFAQRFQEDYPEQYFGQKAQDLNPQDWTNESYTLAKNTVYQTPQNGVLSADYLKQGRQIAEQQVTLAGYRLANLLNSIFG